MVLLQAVAAHPTDTELQCNFVCQAEAGADHFQPQTVPLLPLLPPLDNREEEERRRLYRKAELQHLAETTDNLLVCSRFC